ncbi:MAG: F0F1 ATP synthase subunit epsilon [Oscillospiraceae bacterium]|nr:F0F1 ATP synthase subunit epsilon [Oscillospiraceae bacterium]
MNNNANTENNNAETISRTIRLRVLTPMREVYNKQVHMFIARTVDGDIGVLYGHEPRAAVLTDWAVRIFPEGHEKNQGEELLMILGGMLTVRDNDAVIVSDVAEYPDKMRELLSKMQAERAESKIIEQSSELTTQRIELALRRALINRGEVNEIIINS